MIFKTKHNIISFNEQHHFDYEHNDMIENALLESRFRKEVDYYGEMAFISYNDLHNVFGPALIFEDGEEPEYYLYGDEYSYGAWKDFVDLHIKNDTLETVRYADTYYKG